MQHVYFFFKVNKMQDKYLIYAKRFQYFLSELDEQDKYLIYACIFLQTKLEFVLQ